jgi:hypothetical protein
MSEVDKIFESCQSVTGLPCYTEVAFKQTSDEDEEYFTSFSGGIRHYPHATNLSSRRANSSTAFDFCMSPESDETRQASLALYVAEDETTLRRIRYDLEDGVITRHEQKLSTKVQDVIKDDPFALEEAALTERRETKYTLRALARLAALTTKRMIEDTDR